MTSSTTTVRVRTGHGVGLLDPATYRRTLHLLADLPIGLVTFTVFTTLLSVSAVLAITLIGVPLLIGTLYTARLMGRMERARARALLGVGTPAPRPARPGWRGRLADAAGWRTLAYGLLLGPVGVLTATLTLTGWSTALGALSFPAYAWTLDDPALHLGTVTVSGLPADLGAVACGLVLIAVMPAVVRLLARLDAVLVRGLLR
ncbi:sensor domain-containing protein [Geodermatophilus sp. URMC 62]|uniref:sensor domain-containing protein n=1 Tax=Geodermatophilus sp. URMC 62 TaxID=3423414 RepID=UPI00406C4049